MRWALAALLLVWGCKTEDAPQPAPAPAVVPPSDVADDPAPPEPPELPTPPPSDPTAGTKPLYFYYGPLKPMVAEFIIHSVAAITGHEFGAFDFTVPDQGTVGFRDAGNWSPFYQHCKLLGGCLEHRVPLGRRPAFGAIYMLELEKVVAEACYDRQVFGMFPGGRSPNQMVGAADIIQHQYLQAFAVKPSVEDMSASLKYFDEHLRDPDFEGMPPLEGAGRGHCRALLTSNRFVFY